MLDAGGIIEAENAARTFYALENTNPMASVTCSSSLLLRHSLQLLRFPFFQGIKQLRRNFDPGVKCLFSQMFIRSMRMIIGLT